MATQISFDFHPENWGFMIQLDGCIFFKGVGSTTKEENLGHQIPTGGTFGIKNVPPVRQVGLSEKQT